MRGYTRFPGGLYFNIWANISYGYVGRAAGFDEGTLLQKGAEINAYIAGTNSGGNWVGRQIGIDLWEPSPRGSEGGRAGKGPAQQATRRAAPPCPGLRR